MACFWYHEASKRGFTNLVFKLSIVGALFIPNYAKGDLLDEEMEAPSQKRENTSSQKTSTLEAKETLEKESPVPSNSKNKGKKKETIQQQATKGSGSKASNQPSDEKRIEKVSPRSDQSSASQEIQTSPSLSPSGKAEKVASPAADDSKQPVHFESQGLRALKEKGTAELLDQVVVTQGTLRLEADKAKIFYNDELKDVVRVVAQGNIKIFKIDEESGEKIKAFGDRAEFDNHARTVVLEGNARLWRGADLVRGKRISYELDSGWIRADRVAGEVHPPDDKKTPSNHHH